MAAYPHQSYLDFFPLGLDLDLFFVAMMLIDAKWAIKYL